MRSIIPRLQMWKLRFRKSRNFPRIKGLISVAEAMTLIQTFEPKSSVLPTPPTPPPASLWPQRELEAFVLQPGSCFGSGRKSFPWSH